MATYKSLDTFRPEINQYCPAAPAILIRTHVLKSAIRFCERSLILKKEPSSFYLDEDEHTYTLKFTGDRYRALGIKKATLGEGSSAIELAVTTEEEMSHADPTWREQTGSGNQPSRIWLTEDLNTVRIYPKPNSDSDDELFLECQVAPKRDQTEIDEFLYEKWEDEIQAGAIASLLAIKSSSWYDRQQSKMFADAFKRGYRRARKMALTGTGNYPGRVLPQNFIIMGEGTSGKIRRTTEWV